MGLLISSYRTDCVFQTHTEREREEAKSLNREVCQAVLQKQSSFLAALCRSTSQSYYSIRSNIIQCASIRNEVGRVKPEHMKETLSTNELPSDGRMMDQSEL